MTDKLSAPNVIPSRRTFLKGAAALGTGAAMLGAMNDGARAEGDPIPVGQAAPLTDFASPGADAFAAALDDVYLQLAQLVVRDGEGAQKFITVAVTGAVSDESARRIGLAIANSPLVKTAIAGEDANWGRVVMAVGKAGEPADRDKLSIGFGGVWAAREGQPLADYDEQPVAEHLKGREIDIAVDIGLGSGGATVWTCDLTHGYIAINADYRS